MQTNTQEQTRRGWVSFFDLEPTDVRDGAIIECGAVRVDLETLTDVSLYQTFVKIPEDGFSMSESGKKHLANCVIKCNASPKWEYCLDEFLSFLRGPIIPGGNTILSGYNIEKCDIPILKKWVSRFSAKTAKKHAWLDKASVVDVLPFVARRLKKDSDSAAMSLGNSAKAFGVAVDDLKLHNPLYDSLTTYRLYLSLKKNVGNDISKVKLAKASVMNPNDPEVLVELRRRYNSGEYSPIVCPECNKPGMRLVHSPSIKTADQYLYACEKCGYKMNADGSKGFGTNRTMKCDIDVQRQKYLDFIKEGF